MTPTPTEVRAYEAVAKGAAMLDAKLPGWYDTLDLAWFHIDHADQCVIGQLAEQDMIAFYNAVGKTLGSEDYDWGVDMLSGIILEELPANTPEQRDVLKDRITRRQDWIVAHGFDIADVRPYGGASYMLLQEAWVWEVAQRRHTDPDTLWKTTPYEFHRGVKPRWPKGQEV